MRWKGREQSGQVEDRRGMKPAVVAGGGLITIVIIGVALLMGVNPGQIQQIVNDVQGAAGPAAPGGQPAGVDDDDKEFLGVILRDTEKVWDQIFKDELGKQYRKPKLVIFSGLADTGCGRASSQVGPFYCPADRTVYIDPSFFDELAQRHRAPGDFANAYVIAHEVAHHVQLLIGYSQQVDQIRSRGNERATNRASVRLELQADYLAGVWANHAERAYNILEKGDMQEAIRAANQIGDDTLMKEATGFVVPERYTHGTSEQRVRWFSKGLRSGDFAGCKQLFELNYDDL